MLDGIEVQALSSDGDGCRLAAANSRKERALERLPENGKPSTKGPWESDSGRTARGHWLQWEFSSTASVESFELFLKKVDDSYSAQKVEIDAMVDDSAADAERRASDPDAGKPKMVKVGGGTMGRPEDDGKGDWVKVSLSDGAFDASVLRLYILPSGGNCRIHGWRIVYSTDGARIAGPGPERPVSDWVRGERVAVGEGECAVVTDIATHGEPYGNVRRGPGLLAGVVTRYDRETQAGDIRRTPAVVPAAELGEKQAVDTVAELKAKLLARGLSTKGQKAVLAARLAEAEAARPRRAAEAGGCSETYSFARRDLQPGYTPAEGHAVCFESGAPAAGAGEPPAAVSVRRVTQLEVAAVREVGGAWVRTGAASRVHEPFALPCAGEKAAATVDAAGRTALHVLAALAAEPPPGFTLDLLLACPSALHHADHAGRTPRDVALAAAAPRSVAADLALVERRVVRVQRRARSFVGAKRALHAGATTLQALCRRHLGVCPVAFDREAPAGDAGLLALGPESGGCRPFGVAWEGGPALPPTVSLSRGFGDPAAHAARMERLRLRADAGQLRLPEGADLDAGVGVKPEPEPGRSIAERIHECGVSVSGCAMSKLNGIYRYVEQRKGQACFTHERGTGAFYFDGTYWKICQSGKGRSESGWNYSQRPGDADGLAPPLGVWEPGLATREASVDCPGPPEAFKRP